MPATRGEMQLVIVTGMSGAGKTQAVRCLEDLGFFCVDNLPPKLVPRLAELFSTEEGVMEKVALVMDIRGGRFFEGLFEALSFLDAQGFRYEILYLEAAEETLVRRFKETRRKHPLSPQGRILDGIITERARLIELRGRASKIIDTSELSTQRLREQVAELYGDLRDHRLIITVMSFGYKHGIPLDADLVMDVRFLPNPHYVESLKSLTGQDREVQDYVLNSPVTRTFLARFQDMIAFLIPYFIQEGKSQLVLAIGCTGGQHRSVTLANVIAETLSREQQYRVLVQHRDISRVVGSP